MTARSRCVPTSVSRSRLRRFENIRGRSHPLRASEPQDCRRANCRIDGNSHVCWQRQSELYLATAGAAPASPDGVRRDIRGKRKRLEVYKGVPFAAPPVGDLRWRPRCLPHPGLARARRMRLLRRVCKLGVSMPGETPPAVSEDCLYLNIWTPADSRAGAPAGDRLDLRRRIHQRVGLDALVLGRPARATKASSLSPSLIASARLAFLRFLS
jgi:hypothetical protein